MKNATRLSVLFILLFSGVFLTSAQETTPTASVNADIDRTDFTVELGDGFVTSAQITTPAGQTGPFPTVLLLHGAGAADMDFTVTGFDGQVQSAIFGDIATALSEAGYAVVRYNKRYVTGPGAADFQRYYTLRLPDILADAETMLDAARTQPLVDAEQVYLWGWSEGSVVGAALAAAHPDEIAGVILQGAVGLSFHETFATQFTDVTLPYVETFASDGQIDNAALQAAWSGGAGGVAMTGLAYLTDVSFYQTGEYEISTGLDANSDGVLTIDTEVLPAVDALIDVAMTPPYGFLSIFGGEDVLPPVTEQADLLIMPILLLHGEQDANVTVRSAQVIADALTAAGNTDVTVSLYPGLGHSLGAAATLVEDNFQPIAAAPLQDAIAWLDSNE